jgi:hypothetical protein
VQMWQGGEPSPSGDGAWVSPSPGSDVARLSPSPSGDVAGTGSPFSRGARVGWCSCDGSAANAAGADVPEARAAQVPVRGPPDVRLSAELRSDRRHDGRHQHELARCSSPPTSAPGLASPRPHLH